MDVRALRVSRSHSSVRHPRLLDFHCTDASLRAAHSEGLLLVQAECGEPRQSAGQHYHQAAVQPPKGAGPSRVAVQAAHVVTAAGCVGLRWGVLRAVPLFCAILNCSRVACEVPCWCDVSLRLCDVARALLCGVCVVRCHRVLPLYAAMREGCVFACA